MSSNSTAGFPSPASVCCLEWQGYLENTHEHLERRGRLTIFVKSMSTSPPSILFSADIQKISSDYLLKFGINCLSKLLRKRYHKEKEWHDPKAIAMGSNATVPKYIFYSILCYLLSISLSLFVSVGHSKTEPKWTHFALPTRRPPQHRKLAETSTPVVFPKQRRLTI